MMMHKIGLVAGREFFTTVRSKGFLIGLLIMPAIFAMLAVIGPRIARSGPTVEGEIAVIDPTGSVVTPLRASLEPSAISARRAEFMARTNPSGVPNAASIPLLTVAQSPAGAEVSAEKSQLLPVGEQPPRRLALVVIHPDALVRASGKEQFGAYDLYTSKRLNGATENVIHSALQTTLSEQRLQQGGLDPAQITALTFVPRAKSIVVGSNGEQSSGFRLSAMLPFASGLLLFLGVLTCGQALLTSTVEEKSNRVVEVLLAAAAPLELMWGKLLGQLGVGLLMMAIYIGLAILGLTQFALLGLLDPSLIVYFAGFYLVSYLVFGSLMLAIGAAVNQMADAQSLMGPVMLLLILPYALTPMVGQAPNSTFSIAMSFIPPVNSFVMLARLGSDSPPPAWQALLSMLVGVGAAVATVWFAAKIFRIGLLMHGKPPSFATLIRWARAA